MCRLGRSGSDARGLQDLAARDPEHVARADRQRLAAGHQEIQRDHVGAVAMPQLARDVAVHAAVVDVVAAARQHQAGLAGLLQQSPARGGRPRAASPGIRAARRTPHPPRDRLLAPRDARPAASSRPARFFTCSGPEPEMQRRDQESVLRAAPAPAPTAAPTAASGSTGSSATAQASSPASASAMFGSQHVIHARFEQRLHVAVRHLHRIAGLRHRQFDAAPRRCADRSPARAPSRCRVRRSSASRTAAGRASTWRAASPTLQLAADAAFGSASSSCSRKANRSSITGLRPVARRLAELVRALVAPVALLPLDDELLHVAEVRAGLADEVARRELELVRGRSRGSGVAPPVA